MIKRIALSLLLAISAVAASPAVSMAKDTSWGG